MRIIAKNGGNVTHVLHDRLREESNVNGCYLRVDLETRNFEHIEQIKKELISNGLKLV